MTLLYIDTNIILDALQDRKNLFGKDISVVANKLFYRAMVCEFNIVISTWMLKEAEKYITIEKLSTFFSLLRFKIIKADFTEEDVINAKKLCPEHYEDALHLIIALKKNADILVTRDTAGYTNFEDKIKIKLPEEL